MKKERVLILTRSFPPAARTASARILSFAKNLSEFGYYPIVITRNWDRSIANESEVDEPTGVDVRHEVHENYEVYYIPFPGSLGRRFHNRSFWKFAFIRKIILMTDAYIGNMGVLNPHYSLYRFALRFIHDNEDIRKMLVSVSPFVLLSYGHKLHHHTGINWLIDYRDEWNSRGSIIRHDFSKLPFLSRTILNFLRSPYRLRNSEKRWASTSSGFVSIAPKAVQNISELIEKNGEVLVNGFEPDDLVGDEKDVVQFEKFTITYPGWLYDSQQIDILFDTIKKLSDVHSGKLNLEVLFIGGKAYPDMESKVMRLMSGYDHLIRLTPLVSKAESIRMQRQSHLLLLCAHHNSSDIPSSKMYEYIGLGKPVLICPGDHGILESTMNETRQAIICHTKEEAFKTLSKMYSDFLNGIIPCVNLDTEMAKKYRRHDQVKVLAKMFDQIKIKE